jgi:hypothetical protein
MARWEDKCCFCGEVEREPVFTYKSPPAGETLISLAGFRPVDIFRLQESSTKFTLFAFMKLS